MKYFAYKFFFKYKRQELAIMKYLSLSQYTKNL